MRIKPIVDLLKAAHPVVRIHGAVRYALDVDQMQFTQDFYVFATTTAAAENQRINGHRQALTEGFAVVLGTRSINDPLGADSVDALEELRESIRDALVGIQLEGCDLPISYVGGKLLKFAGGVALWQEDFTTQSQYCRKA